MFKPTRRGFLQALFVAPVVAAAVEAPKPLTLTVKTVVDNQAGFYAGLGNLTPSKFVVPQNPFWPAGSWGNRRGLYVEGWQ